MTLEDQEGEDGGGQDVEAEARLLGWVPPEEWTGNKDDCISAEEFVDRGKHLMPILRQNNNRLKNELLTRDREIGTLKANLENAQKAIDRLDAHYTAANKRAVETAKAQLKEQLREARENGDLDAEEEVRDKLADIKASETATDKEEAPAKGAPTPQDLDPAFTAWNNENPWFGNMKDPEDKKKTKMFSRMAEDLRDEGDTSSGREFLDKCAARVAEELGEAVTTQNRGSRVEGSAGGRSAARPGAGGFGSLPKDAQDACHADADYLVGKGKKYPTMKDWEADYARIYNAQ